MIQLPDFADNLLRDLRGHLELCQQTLALMTSESRALAGEGTYDAFTYCQQRKGLLPAIEASLNNLRRWRQLWQQVGPNERAAFSEANQMFQVIQNSMMRILLLDRENQQAMLRRGLVPAQHLPAVASQQSHFVSGIYRRHSAG
jgi:hypothetical protein